MAVWYSLWSFVIFFTIWYVWTKKNLATLLFTEQNTIIIIPLPLLSFDVGADTMRTIF
jgi:hypothetical protein